MNAPTPQPDTDGAVALFRSRQFTQAARRFAAIAQQAAAGQGGAPRLLLAEARAWFLARDLDRARDAARRAARLDPALLGVPLMLARIAAANNNPAGSITHLRRAVSLNGGSASLRVTLARRLAEVGRFDEALATARDALAANPCSESASLVIADCHFARGDPTLARLALARLNRERPAFATPDPVRPPPPAPKARPRPRQPSVLDHVLVIRACMLRGFSLRHAGNPFWLPLELVRPTAVITAHWILFAVLHKPMPGQIPIPIFVLAGFSVWFAFNYAAQGAANGANQPTGALAWPGVTPMHLRLARALWPLLVNLGFCLLAILPLRFVRPDLPSPALPLTVLVFATAGIGGIGYGLLAERLAAVVPAFGVAEKLVSWLLFVTCGLYFVVYQATPLLAHFLLLNPLLHLIDFERHAFDPGYPIGLVDLRYPITLAAIVFVLGLACCRAFPAAARAAFAR